MKSLIYSVYVSEVYFIRRFYIENIGDDAMDDKKITELLESSREEGLRAAISLYGGYCKAIAMRILSNSADVEECLSEVFFRLWRFRKKANSCKGGLKAYLAAVTRNCARDMLKKRKNTLPIDEIAEVSDGESVSDSHEQKLVREAVESLENPEKEIFMRRYFRAEKVKEIAAAMGISAKSVENRLFRGKKRLFAKSNRINHT